MNEPSQDPSALPPELEEGLEAGFGAPSHPGGSILDRLAKAAGVRPRISLREEPDRLEKVLRPRGSGADWNHLQGKYQVQGEIARGGVGVVLKGHDTDLGRDVAMKLLHEKYAGNAELLERFVEEAQIGGQLQHPGIVPVYDLGLSGDRPFFTMKLIKGSTLAALIAEDIKVDSGKRRHLVGVFEQVCLTMAYAHSRGVIHRDLKPANVMVGAFREVHVVDWGMGKVLSSGGTADEERSQRLEARSIIETIRSRPGSGSTHSVVGSLMGTPAYMPPEQANGAVEDLDERSDVFSLGAILCEILTGSPPYPGSNEEAILLASKAMLGPCHERLRTCAADEELVELCIDCMRPSPAARPRHAHEVADRLGAHLAGIEERARAARVEAAEERVRAEAARRSQRLTVMLALSLMTILGISAGGAYWLERESRDRAEAATRAVGDSMEATEARLDRALQARSFDLVLWEQARNAAEQSVGLSRQEGVSTIQREAVARLDERVRREGDRAARRSATLERAQRLMGDLEQVHVPEDLTIGRSWMEEDAQRQDEDFRAAFARFMEGRSIEDLPVESSLEALDPIQDRVVLAAFIEHWAMLQSTLLNKDDRGPAVRLRDLARELDPGDRWRAELRGFLEQPEPDRAGIVALARRTPLEDLHPASINLLAGSLTVLGAEREAREVYDRAFELHSSDFGICLRLAILLWREPEPSYGRVAELLAIADALRPGILYLVLLRCNALSRIGDHVTANRVVADLLAKHPEHNDVLLHMTGTLGRLEDHEAHLAMSERHLNNLLPPPRSPSQASQHASASFGRAEALQELGRYGEALAAYRSVQASTGLDLEGGGRGGVGAYATVLTIESLSATRVLEMEQLVADLPLLEGILEAPDQVDDAKDLLRAARMGYQTGAYGAAVRAYARALEVGEEVTARQYYLAGSTAVRASLQPNLSSEERAALRRTALSWLGEGLEALRWEDAGHLDAVEFHLTSWRSSPRLAPVRERPHWDDLITEERTEWRVFWADLDVLLGQVRDRKAER